MLFVPASVSLFFTFALASVGGGGVGDLRFAFGGVFSRPSAPSPFALALASGLAFCISRWTTSSAILGEGGDGGGAVAFPSWTILFSTGSYRCSLRIERIKLRLSAPSHLHNHYMPSFDKRRELNGHLFFWCYARVHLLMQC